MASTEERIIKLVEENLDLEHPPDLDAEVTDSGVSSLNLVRFLKLVNQEFDLEIPPGEVDQFHNLRSLIAYLETHTD